MWFLGNVIPPLAISVEKHRGMPQVIVMRREKKNIEEMTIPCIFSTIYHLKISEGFLSNYLQSNYLQSNFLQSNFLQSIISKITTDNQSLFLFYRQENLRKKKSTSKIFKSRVYKTRIVQAPLVLSELNFWHSKVCSTLISTGTAGDSHR